MKHIIRISITACIAVSIGACAAQAASTPVFQGDNPYAAQPADGSLQRDDVTIDSATVVFSQSLPPQVLLIFTYFPATPCHQLRVEASGADARNRIDITAYSVVEKGTACTLAEPATPPEASLSLGSLPSGHYSLFLNGELVDEFDV